MFTLLLAALVLTPMLIEARRAARNERAQLQRGGIEARPDVYGVMRVAYPAAFAVMILEHGLRGGGAGRLFVAGVVLFIAAKALKWWAILTLGPSWTFRVIVVPGAPLVDTGPYHWMRHPNYAGVIGELIGVGLMAGAWLTGPISVVAFGCLILNRMTVENRALGSRLR